MVFPLTKISKCVILFYRQIKFSVFILLQKNSFASKIIELGGEKVLYEAKVVFSLFLRTFLRTFEYQSLENRKLERRTLAKIDSIFCQSAVWSAGRERGPIWV